MLIVRVKYNYIAIGTTFYKKEQLAGFYCRSIEGIHGEAN